MEPNEMQWRDMADAPKDRPILLLVENFGEGDHDANLGNVVIGRWQDRWGRENELMPVEYQRWVSDIETHEQSQAPMQTELDPIGWYDLIHPALPAHIQPPAAIYQS